MKTKENENKLHSAEYFGESRNFWWNDDFLQLMSERLELRRAGQILDVGCGIGHWGQVLAPVLSPAAQVTGVDREESWVAKATERAALRGLSHRYRYLQADATKLPFEDQTFDLVTCQTVLIHLKDPLSGLKEMLRVLKPGGLILVAEPNNFANQAVASSLTDRLSVDEVMDRLRFDLILQRGKRALGLGSNSEGDLIPGYLAELKAENIQVYLSDKASPYFPPYASQEEQVNLQQIQDWQAREFMGWDQDEALHFFLAGGGSETDFIRGRERCLQDDREILISVHEGKYHSAGGGVTYLISAVKPKVQ